MRIFEQGYSECFDGPGTRLIYYLKGCNFRCRWCGAPESINFYPETLNYPERSAEVGRDISPEAIAAKAAAAGDFISGVTFGGGEPTLQSRELPETLSLLHKEGIHCAMESNASTPEYPSVASAVDLLYSDLKTLDADIFARNISPDTALLEKVKRNLRFAACNQPNFVLRIPVISGVNDSRELWMPLADFCSELLELSPRKSLEVQLLRQHPALPKYKALGRTYPYENCDAPGRELLAEFADELKIRKINATYFG